MKEVTIILDAQITDIIKVPDNDDKAERAINAEIKRVKRKLNMDFAKGDITKQKIFIRD